MSGEAAGGEPSALYGVMCTYRRRDAALDYLDRVDAQTLRPALVVVVDNGSDPSLAAAIAGRPTDSVPVRYIDPGGNIGPAGAFRVGLDALRGHAAKNAFVVHFDDDDPPVDDMQLEQLVTALRMARRSDPAVGALGLSGGRLNPRTGLVAAAGSERPFADADHLHGGYLPVYAFETLDATGGNDPSFFFGFEELELGRRIHLAGFRQMVATDLAAAVVGRYPKKDVDGVAARREGEPAWSRFHKERNLIRILRRERLWSAIVFTVVVRHLLKPLSLCLRRPRVGWRRLVIGVRASWSGLRDEGGIDPRYPPLDR